MVPVTRQDVQNIVDISRNRVLERVATKQDITVLADTVRTLNNLHLQSQQLLKQSEYQRSQLTRRAVALEARLGQLENDLRSINATMLRLIEQKQQQQIVMPAPAAAPAEQQPTPLAQPYAYRPQ